MSGLLEKLKGTAKQAVDTRTRGLSGFETGVGDSIATQDLADGLYENPRESVAVPTRRIRDHHGGVNPSKAFTSKGSVGKQFNPEGPVGGSAQAVGGPFDKEGAIGKQFTNKGAVGGAVDSALGEKKDPAGEFTSKGSVGKQFNPDGPIGSTAQAAGGPFDKEGAIGHKFTDKGFIGGNIDKSAHEHR